MPSKPSDSILTLSPTSKEPFPDLLELLVNTSDERLGGLAETGVFGRFG